MRPRPGVARRPGDVGAVWPVWLLEGLPSGTHTLWVRARSTWPRFPTSTRRRRAGTAASGPTTRIHFVWTTTGEPDTIIDSGPHGSNRLVHRTVSSFTPTSLERRSSARSTGRHHVALRSSREYQSRPVPAWRGRRAPGEHEFEVVREPVPELRRRAGHGPLTRRPTSGGAGRDAAGDRVPRRGRDRARAVPRAGAPLQLPRYDDLGSSFELEFECAFDNTSDAAPCVGGVWRAGSGDCSSTTSSSPTSRQARTPSKCAQSTSRATPTRLPHPCPRTSLRSRPSRRRRSTRPPPDMGVDLQTDSTTVTFTFSGTGASFHVRARLDGVQRPAGLRRRTPMFLTGSTCSGQAVAPFGTPRPVACRVRVGERLRHRPDVTITSAPPPTVHRDLGDVRVQLDRSDGVLPVHARRHRAAPVLVGVEYAGLLAGEQNPHTFEVARDQGGPARRRRALHPRVDDHGRGGARDGPACAAPGRPERERGRLPVHRNRQRHDHLRTSPSMRARRRQPFEPCSSPWSSPTCGRRAHVPGSGLDEAPSHRPVAGGPRLERDRSAADEDHRARSVSTPGRDQHEPGRELRVPRPPRLDLRVPPRPGRGSGADPLESCTSPTSYTGLTNGEHLFEVRATTLPLNGHDVEARPRVRVEIDVTDATAPPRRSSSGLRDPTTNASATFVFSGTDNLTAPPDLTFECSLDGAAFEDSESGDVYPGLPVGPHTFPCAQSTPTAQRRPTPASRSGPWSPGTTTRRRARTSTSISSAARDDLHRGHGCGGHLDLRPDNGSPPHLPAPSGRRRDLLRRLHDGEVPRRHRGLPALRHGLVDEPHLIHLDDGEWVDVTSSTRPGDRDPLWPRRQPLAVRVAEARGMAPETDIVQAPQDPPPVDPGRRRAAVPVLLPRHRARRRLRLHTRRRRLELLRHAVPVQRVCSATTRSGPGDDRRGGPRRNACRVHVDGPGAAGRDDRVRPADQAPGTPDIENESRTATFEFSSDQVGSTFECRLTGEATGTTWQTCTSPETYEDLALGEYTFEVQAIKAGNASFVPAQYEWEVADLTPRSSRSTTGRRVWSTRPRRRATSTSRPTSRRLRVLARRRALRCLQSGVTYTGLGLGAAHVRRPRRGPLRGREPRASRRSGAGRSPTSRRRRPISQTRRRRVRDDGTFAFSTSDNWSGTVRPSAASTARRRSLRARRSRTPACRQPTTPSR